MAKEIKSKKLVAEKSESLIEKKEEADVSYFNSVGIHRNGRNFRVVISKVGSDGSSKMLEEYKAEARSDALEVFKLWAVTKIYDPIIKES